MTEFLKEASSALRDRGLKGVVNDVMGTIAIAVGVLALYFTAIEIVSLMAGLR